jgi:hypothetical protein
MKFVDGLANVAGTTPFATATELVSSGLVHPYDLLTEILVQQSQKRFSHSFDPVEYILFETNLSGTLLLGEMWERCISPMPPMKYQKPVDAGA